VNTIKYGDVTWEDDGKDNINLTIQNVFTFKVRKEDFYGFIKNFREIHRDFENEDDEREYSVSRN